MLRGATLLALAFAGLVLPVFRLPRPSGPYPVGTLLLDGAQIWYPAAKAEGVRAGYGPDHGDPARRILHHARTGAWIGPPAAAGRFPLVIYTHGWGGTAWENTGLLQDLASHGYIAAAAAAPLGVVEGVDLAAPMDIGSPAAWAATQRIAAVKLHVQVQAAQALLARLTELDGGSGVLGGHCDLHQVTALGFSFGGATAAEWAATDPRVRAAINMDGLLFGQARATGVAVPYLEFSDDEPLPAEPPASQHEPEPTLMTVQRADDAAMRANLKRHGGLLLTIAGSLHVNFTDDPGLLPWRKLTGAGPIAPARAHRIIATWVVGFLDHGLRGTTLPDPAADPAIHLESWPRPLP